MNLYSIIFIGVISLLAMFTVAYLVVAVSHNFINGLVLRNNLAERMGNLRIHKMLQKRKIDANQYLHEIPIHKIENQIRNCESCHETDLCDAVLSPDSKLKTNFSFCPNTQAFNKLIENNLQKGKT